MQGANKEIASLDTLCSGTIALCQTSVEMTPALVAVAKN